MPIVEGYKMASNEIHQNLHNTVFPGLHGFNQSKYKYSYDDLKEPMRYKVKVASSLPLQVQIVYKKILTCIC